MGILQTAIDGARARALESGSLTVEAAMDATLDEIVRADPSLAVEEAQVRVAALSELSGFGPLQSFLDDPTIEEIWINRPNQVFIARSGLNSEHRVDLGFEQLRSIIERMLRFSGRRLDRSSPFVDASLPDGSRLHVAIPDVTREFWSVNIRKFNPNILRLSEMVASGSITESQFFLLRDAVRSGKNILVSGATQAGKTTLLCALLAELDPGERLISVEETFEIRSDLRDWVALQTRAANAEGVGEIGLRRLVKEALRMRPSRLVVGEVREAESLDLLIALNSGLPGLSTIHANSALEAVDKICTLPLLAGPNITTAFVSRAVGASLDLVVHCELATDGKRRVAEIATVSFDRVSGQIRVTPVEPIVAVVQA